MLVAGFLSKILLYVRLPHLCFMLVLFVHAISRTLAGTPSVLGPYCPARLVVWKIRGSRGRLWGGKEGGVDP